MSDLNNIKCGVTAGEGDTSSVLNISQLTEKKQAFEAQIKKHKNVLEYSEYLPIDKEKTLKAQIDGMQNAVNELDKLIELLKEAEEAGASVEDVVADYAGDAYIPKHWIGDLQWRDVAADKQMVPSSSLYLGTIYVDEGKTSTITFMADETTTDIKVNTQIDALSGNIYQIITFNYKNDTGEMVWGSYVVHDNPDACFIIDSFPAAGPINIDCSQAIRVGIGNMVTTQATNGFVIYCPDANSGQNRVLGSMGKDLIFGGAYSDYINGMGGNDGVYGNTGDDILIGGGGVDAIEGGGGIDTGDILESEYHPDKVDTENFANIGKVDITDELKNQIVQAGEDWDVSVDNTKNIINLTVKDEALNAEDILSEIKINLVGEFTMISGQMENQKDLVFTLMSAGPNPQVIYVKINGRFDTKLFDRFDSGTIKLIGNEKDNIIDLSQIRNAVSWLEGGAGNDILLSSSDEFDYTHSIIDGGSGKDLMVGNNDGNEMFTNADLENDIIVGGSSDVMEDSDSATFYTANNDSVSDIEQVVLGDALENPESVSVSLEALYSTIDANGHCSAVNGSDWKAKVDDAKKEIVLTAANEDISKINLMMPQGYNAAMQRNDGVDLLVTFFKQTEDGIVAAITLRIENFNMKDIELVMVNEFGQLIKPVQF